MARESADGSRQHFTTAGNGSGCWIPAEHEAGVVGSLRHQGLGCLGSEIQKEGVIK